MILDYISDVCEILGIPEPVVSFDISSFETETTLAQCKSDGSEIYLKKFDKPNLDQLFSIAHELRHIWQIQKDKTFLLTDYKPRTMCKSTEEYNLQPAEIDANAFATIVMVDFFGVKPLYNGLSNRVKLKIKSRIDKISSDF